MTQGIVDAYPHPRQSVTVSFTVEQINRRLGTEISGERMAEILGRLGFEVSGDGSSYQAKVPSWRNDVSLMDDISEEIARIHGFENIASTMPWGSVVQGYQSPRQNFMDEIRGILVSLGMCEELSFGFTHLMPAGIDKAVFSEV